jgi:transitional endoplasmic reticulum ATPase
MSKPQQSPPPSTLDKFRTDLSKVKIAPAWDLEDEDPVVRHHILKFLLNLVEQTNPASRLAYQICHYMESDYLEIPGLQEIFPLGRKEFKKSQKKTNQERKELETRLKASRAELRSLKSPYKGKTIPPEMNGAIELVQADIVDIERDLGAIGKDSEYKESYPIKTAAQGTKKGVKQEDWATLRDFLSKKTKKAPANKDSNFLKNAEMLCDHLGFSQHEKEALIVILLSDEDSNFNGFLENIISGKQKNAHAIIAKMLRTDREVISKIFSVGAPLIEKGILLPVSELEPVNDDDYDGEDVLPGISDHLVRVLKEPDLTLEAMMKHFVGEPAETHLDWDRDFAYLGEGGNELIRMLQGAKESGQLGVNVLLYGLPGTGKTEAVKAAAKKVGLELYVVGEKSKSGKEPTRHDRVTSAILAQELLSGNKNAAVLLDEMEDLFPAKASLAEMFGGEAEPSNSPMGENDKEKSGVSKVFLNRLLERNRTITLWAANRPDRFDPAFRRRIMYSIEFRVPPADVREKIWASVSARHDFKLNAGETRSLASSFVVPPALMENAIRHASMSGGGMAAIHNNLRAASGLLFRNRRAIDARDEVPSHYDLRFLNTTVEASEFSLSSLGDNIKGSGRRDFSMLLYGPAGTGKTQYFAYLAKLLDMDVMVKDAASLNDKYVGETEKRISEAFAEAEERGMFLVIDEADTFLRRREDLGSNYEVSAVNTMLTSMERHTQPFGCTTNLFQNVDPAAKRRFLFKVAFDYLTPAQTSTAFNHFFNMDAPDTLNACPKLVPSDFVNVRKQAGFISGEVTPERLVRLLSLEAKSRLDANSNLYAGNDKFGFTPK